MADERPPILAQLTIEFVRLVLHANFGPTTVTIYGIRVPVILPEAYFLIAITLEIRL